VDNVKVDKYLVFNDLSTFTLSTYLTQTTTRRVLVSHAPAFSNLGQSVCSPHYFILLLVHFFLYRFRFVWNCRI